MLGKGLPAGGSLAFGAEFHAQRLGVRRRRGGRRPADRSARSARVIGVAVLGASYALRVGGDISAIGDGKLSWLSWLSPIGWVTHIFPYWANNWWAAGCPCSSRRPR